MAMWPVSTRVNKPENDDASLLYPATGFPNTTTAAEPPEAWRCAELEKA